MHRDRLRPSTNHLFMIDTDDIEKTYEYMKQKKADIQSDIEGEERVKFFEVLDSEGNKIMFCEEKE
jgi:predicted enzyme related to lactoylglutathione lyase